MNENSDLSSKTFLFDQSLKATENQCACIKIDTIALLKPLLQGTECLSTCRHVQTVLVS